VDVTTLLDWHHTVAWVLVVSNAVVAVWCLAAHYVRRLRGWPLWGAVAVAQLTTFAQAILGTILMSRHDLEPPQLHALYGFSAIIAVGILFSYRSSPFMRGKQYLLYAGGSAFIMGLGLREVLALS
jgi:hypothetical protein